MKMKMLQLPLSREISGDTIWCCALVQVRIRGPGLVWFDCHERFAWRRGVLRLVSWVVSPDRSRDVMKSMSGVGSVWVGLGWIGF
jgi:hypothetical protein